MYEIVKISIKCRMSRQKSKRKSLNNVIYQMSSVLHFNVENTYTHIHHGYF